MANNKINKINVLGTIYDIGGGGSEAKSFHFGRTIDNSVSNTAIKFGSTPGSNADYSFMVFGGGAVMEYVNPFDTSKTIYAWRYSGGSSSKIKINGVEYDTTNYTYDNPLLIELDELPYDVIFYCAYTNGGSND